MRLLVAALALSFTVALVAAVFAMWPVVADAPWEQRPQAVQQEESDTNTDRRCDAALQLRDTATEAIGQLPVKQPVTRGGFTLAGGVDKAQLKAIEEQLTQAEREIARYC